MFNPKNSIISSDIWGALGTFYNKLDGDSKIIVETYWNSLFNGLEGLYHDLVQADRSDNITSPGYIHEVNSSITVNTGTLSRSISGVYSVSLKDPYYSILSLSGMYTGETLTSGSEYALSGLYNIVFTDKQALQDILYDGTPNIDNIHSIYEMDLINFSSTGNRNLCIAELNEEGFYNNVDFAILDGTSIRVTNLKALQYIIGYETEKFIYDGLRVPGVLFNLLLAKFDIYNTSAVPDIITGRLYEPYLSYYGTATGITKDALYASTLSRWAYATQNSMLVGPTMGGIVKTLNLLYNAPFSYFDGVIYSVTADVTHHIVEILSDIEMSLDQWYKIEPYIENSVLFFEDSIPAVITDTVIDYPNNKITITGNITYRIPLECTLSHGEGDDIFKFEILVDGLSINDYISSSATISGVTNWSTNPEEYYSTLYVSVPSEFLDFNYYARFVQYYINDALPPGLIIKGNISKTFVDKPKNSIQQATVVAD